MEKTFYGLRVKKNQRMLGVECRSSDSDFSVDVIHTLVERSGSDRVWMALSPEHAEWVRHNSTKWYNATMETPQHAFKPEELEIVAVTTTITESPITASIPTSLEIFTELAKKDKGHTIHAEMAKDGRIGKWEYDLWRLKDYLRLKERK